MISDRFSADIDSDADCVIVHVFASSCSDASWGLQCLSSVLMLMQVSSDYSATAIKHAQLLSFSKP